MSSWRDTKTINKMCVTFSDVCSDVADVKSQEEAEEREDSSISENGMQCAEGVTDPCICTHTHICTDIFPSHFAF